MDVDRRKLIKGGLLSSLAALATVSSAKAEILNSCKLTATQPEGPFYPVNDQLDKDGDLVWLKGRNVRAKGELILLKGVVRDQNCRPIKNALVDIWQACATGKYNHPGDPSPAKLDPNFAYWGQVRTNDKGEYQFRTIKPGSYEATDTWERPPHIHMKVHLRGHVELITQVYFSEDVLLNRRDRILRELGKEDQNNVIIDFKPVQHMGEKHRMGSFDVTLQAM